MANKDHYKIFYDVIVGKKDYQEWMKLKSSVDQVDLTQVDLSNKKINNMNLSKVNFSGANFFDCDLVGVDLTGANLNYANMKRINLSNAFLDDASLAGANMEGANLVDTSFERADLTGAKLCGAYLVGSKFIDAIMVEVNLRGANMKYAVVEGADLKNANVDEADLTGVNIPESMLKMMKGVNTAIISKKVPKGEFVTDETLVQTFKEEDAYNILDLKTSASLEDVVKAYKMKAKEYHPDKVVHLGEKLQKLAHLEFERINKAKEYLVRKLRNPLVVDAPVSPKVRSERGITLQDYINIANNNPNNDVALYNLAVKYHEMGLIQKAIETYKKCLQTNPNNHLAKHNLKIALFTEAFMESK